MALPPTDTPVPAGTTFAPSDQTALVVERMRAAMWLAMGAIVLFAVIDLALTPHLIGRLWTIAGVQLAALAAGLCTLRPWMPRRAAVRVALASVSVVLATGAVSDALSSNLVATAVSGVVGSLLAAALIPWGVRAQLIYVAIAALAGGSALIAAGGTSGALLPLIVPGLLALSGSVYLASVMDRLRAARRAIEHELRLLRAVALAAGEAEGFDEALAAVVRHACAVAGAAFGQAWLAKPDGSLVVGPVWHEPDATLTDFATLFQHLTIQPGTGLPGRVWLTRRVEDVADIGTDADFVRGAEARLAGLGAALAVPIVSRGETLAVLELFLREGTEGDEGLAHMLASVAGQLDAVLQRKRAEDELARSRDQAQEDAQVAACLLRVSEVCSSRLGADDLLGAVNALAAEAIGCDWSSTFIAEAGGSTVRHVANAGSSPRVKAMFGSVTYRRTDFAIFEPAWKGEMIEIADADTQPDDLRAVLNATESASLIIAPVLLNGGFVGFQVHGNRELKTTFSVRQRRLASGIAHATAIALENARLIDRLEGASAIKTELVATLAHEIRTPLNVMTGYAEMLEEGVAGVLNEGQRDFVARIRRASRTMLDLSTATLDLRRIEAGRETVTLEPVDVSELFAELAEGLAPIAAPGVTMVWSADAVPDRIATDRLKLETVVKNLAGNALKFTHQGRVEVAAVWAADTLTVSVRDTGVGISADHVPVIFEMFRQVGGVTTKRFPGVGLGLHIVKRIVDLLGGDITVTSNVGVGSTFVVTVPATMASRLAATA